MNNQQQQMQVGVKFTDDDAKGRFANAAQVSHQEDFFILDFLLVAPPAGQLVSRVVVTPSHMKRIAKVIDDQMKAYENTFGKVGLAEDKSMGFRTP
jgi:hypothetical protein